MLLILSFIVCSYLLCGFGHDGVSLQDKASLATAFRVESDQVILIDHDEVAKEKNAENLKYLAARDVEFEGQAPELIASSAHEPEKAKGGWYSRVCGSIKRWWKEASWKKRIASVAVGTTVVCAGAVYLNSNYYLVFKSIKDYYTHFGANAPGDVVINSSGIVLAPTSSEVATSILASAAGSAASATLTPTELSPFSVGRCDAPATNLEQYTAPEGCHRFDGYYNGSCVPRRGCAYNGDSLYSLEHGPVVCRCKRVCNAPPKDLPCYGYNGPNNPIESCEHLPLCDRCIPHWCKVCNGWIPDAINIYDLTPSDLDIRAWMNHYGITGLAIQSGACLPGSIDYY